MMQSYTILTYSDTAFESVRDVCDVLHIKLPKGRKRRAITVDVPLSDEQIFVELLEETDCVFTRSRTYRASNGTNP